MIFSQTHFNESFKRTLSAVLQTHTERSWVNLASIAHDNRLQNELGSLVNIWRLANPELCELITSIVHKKLSGIFRKFMENSISKLLLKRQLWMLLLFSEFMSIVRYMRAWGINISNFQPSQQLYNNDDDYYINFSFPFW